MPLGSIPSLKKRKKEITSSKKILVLWEVETGGSGFAASLSSLSLSLLSEALCNFVRPGFKIKYKK